LNNINFVFISLNYLFLSNIDISILFLIILLPGGVFQIVASQLQQFLEGGGKVVEEAVIILCLHFDLVPELTVFNESHVCGQHHDLLVFSPELAFACAGLAFSPFVFEQQRILLIVEHQRRGGPGTFLAACIWVASAQRVGTA